MPSLTHRVVSPEAAPPSTAERPMATELTLRAPWATADAVATVTAATLGAPAPSPVTESVNPASPASHEVAPASLPIQHLADRIFRILERRLVVERERRGIRQ